MTQFDDTSILKNDPSARVFSYGLEATDYLAAKDARMALVIEQVGHVYRALDGDLFSSVMHHIVGQQISTKAQATVWRRMREGLGEPDARHVAEASIDELQAFGMTFRKAEYIREFAGKVVRGEFDLEAIARMPDAEAVAALSSLSGVSTWTAEMILLFCLERPDVFSYDDLAIQRGLRMVYHHRAITRPLFEKYRRRFSPYGSVASLYLWEVAGGAVEGLRDHAPKTSRKKPSKKGAAQAKQASQALRPRIP